MEAIRDRVVELRRVKAGELRANPKNWRTHPEKQRQALSGVLREIGYADALLARETDDGLELIDGHLRAEVTPDVEVPVLVLDLDEEEAAVLLATLDPLAAMAGVAGDKLADLLATITTDDPALQAMLDNLSRQAQAAMDELAGVEVEVPAPPDTPVTRLGDLWLLGDFETGHRLLCGDSGSESDVNRLLDDGKGGLLPVHLCNMDPPYNVKVEPRSNNAIAAGLSSFAPTPAKHHQKFDVERHPGKSKGTTRQMRAKDRPLANDFVSDEAFEQMLLAWFGTIARVLLPGRAFYIWGGYANVANYPPALKACGLYFSQTIIWDKEHPVLTRKDFMGAHEWCFYGWKEGAAHVFLGPNNVPDLWHVKKVNPQSMVHLTEKPVELGVRAMNYSSRPGEHVIDLFGGSGSTLIAAEQTGRRTFLMELDPAYSDIILQRWSTMTGREPVLASTGRTFSQVAAERRAEKAADSGAAKDTRAV